MSKLQLNVVSPENRPRASDMYPTEVFRTFDYDGTDLYVRVSPAAYLMNSKTIKESITAGKVLVMSIKKGDVYFIQGDREVIRVKSAKITVEP
jgi:hypothetical protein